MTHAKFIQSKLKEGYKFTTNVMRNGKLYSELMYKDNGEEIEYIYVHPYYDNNKNIPFEYWTIKK